MQEVRINTKFFNILQKKRALVAYVAV